ncbi:MAG: methyl-accepting chemotaxis protein [Eubacteriales bacterium]|nr:methyl-accepting chemotaxis protein [Eubacteriales bacterium]
MKKINEMSIGKRLKSAFNIVIVILAVMNLVGLVVIFGITNRYNFTLSNYAFPQGDIGKAMTAFADTRSATRAFISYDDANDMKKLLAVHDQKKEELEGYMDAIEGTMVTEAGHQSYAAIESALDNYFAIEEKVIKTGNSTDREQCKKAQEMAFDQLSPAYDKAYSEFSHLMDVNVEKGDMMHTILSVVEVVAMVVILVGIVVVVLLSAKISKKVADGIAVPLNDMAVRFKSFAEGDLTSEFPEVESKDEIAQMRGEAYVMAERLQQIIADVENIMSEMAEGNFAVNTEIEEKYTGDFNPLLMTIRKMNRAMSTTLKEVEEAARQVEAGANNMAEGAQALAEGAMDQAASVEEMQATMTDLTSGVEKTAEHVNESYQQAQKYSKEAQNSRMEMEVLVEAMKRISETSQDIGSIVSEIENIASQTNLLSLNASIEAARAGEAGRGFAVVADQIRNLAEQSAKSAVDTRELIEGSLREVEEGNNAAQRAATAMTEVVEGMNMIADSSQQLSEISAAQADAMEQAEAGIDRISEVVQSNSATAEESSATSEELSAQATAMSELVGRFKLRD